MSPRDQGTGEGAVTGTVKDTLSDVRVNRARLALEASTQGGVRTERSRGPGDRTLLAEE